MSQSKKTSGKSFVPFIHKRDKTNYSHSRSESNNSAAVPLIIPPPKTLPALIRFNFDSNKSDVVIETTDEDKLTGVNRIEEKEKHNSFEEIVIKEVEKQLEVPVEHLEEQEKSPHGITNEQLEPLTMPEEEINFDDVVTEIVADNKTENGKKYNEKAISIIIKRKKKHFSSITLKRDRPQTQVCKGSIHARKVTSNKKRVLKENEIPMKCLPSQGDFLTFEKRLPTIKVPTLLTRVNIEYDFTHSLDLLLPASRILKISWKVHSYEGRVLLPSNILFLEGILIADIEFICKNNNNTIHNKRISIPWGNTTSVNWINQPSMFSNNEKQYMFQSSDTNEISCHHEYEAHYADPIQYDLRRLNFIWHDEFKSQVDSSILCIHGTAQLSFDLLQQQLIDLNLL